MRRGALVAALALSTLAVAVAAEHKRYEGPLVHFSYPADATAAPGADPSADVAVTVTFPDGIVATVLGSEKKVADGELDSVATNWHAARIKNRAAWGMKAAGGPPRDSVRIGERRWLRWRDRIGSVLGAQEQTMTCGSVNGHLGCVVVSAPQKERERADGLAAHILTSLSIKKK
jgi:hypothetical protein